MDVFLLYWKIYSKELLQDTVQAKKQVSIDSASDLELL